MFTIVTTYVKQDYAWEEKDISSWTLNEVLKLQNGRFTVDWNGEYERDFYVSVNRSLMVSSDTTLTLSAWVQTLSEDALQLTTKANGLRDSNVVSVFDVYDVASEVTRANVLYGAGNPIPEGAETDIKFKTGYPSFDKRATAKLAETSLAMVNGLIHPMTLQGEYLYILGAYERFKVEEDQLINLIDFSEIGGIETINIEESSVTEVTRTLNDQQRHVTRMVINAGKDMSGCVPLLVLDGYLHTIDDGSYEIVDRDKILLEVDHYLAMQRAARKPEHTRSWISPANLQGNGVNVSTFDSKQYLVDNNSFIVLVKNTDLAFMREPLGKNALYRTYYHYRAPKGIVFFDDMLMANAAINDYNEHEVQIITGDNRRPTWTYEVVPLPKLNAFAEQGYSRPKEGYKDAHVLEIYSFA
ncbi:hypothetical protein [Vibrio phage vB_VmeM-Yong XC32]|nr:hypothetical protein [Vibrio phage vB_VmeM-Yong XC31]QAX96475.1 hypothetical protein [Vibrio phage vB_VmeM-Yong XC32]QAX96792.1 hypothetical protein [Vibrio phage vB_VmeM-Yong MS31]QAX97111.1 hypothetical protein [Vibrio phage vB_VmeM-Yong MS32]